MDLYNKIVSIDFVSAEGKKEQPVSIGLSAKAKKEQPVSIGLVPEGGKKEQPVSAELVPCSRKRKQAVSIDFFENDFPQPKKRRTTDNKAVQLDCTNVLKSLGISETTEAVETLIKEDDVVSSRLESVAEVLMKATETLHTTTNSLIEELNTASKNNYVTVKN